MRQAIAMNVLSFTNAVAFAERVGPVIDRHPAQASVLATFLDQSIHGPGFETHWFLIQDGDRPVGAAMHTAMFGLFLTPLPETDGDLGMAALAETLQQAGLRPSGAMGPLDTATTFVQAWEQRTGATSRRTDASRLYEIDSPPQRPAVSGSARLAGEADLDVATRWTREFDVEAGQPPADPERTVRRRLERGRLVFWEDGDQPVSMAGISRPISGVVRVGGVYTPKTHRRHGFGAAVTVAATQQGFDDGADRCVLYADLANPTSNGIYLKIGYRPVGDSALFTFDQDPAASRLPQSEHSRTPE